jgi:uncharacterized membrane protein YgdD (TMEM256/DUF423 family)
MTPRTTRTFTLIAAIYGFLAVALGAFGAHALKSTLTVDSLNIWETGVRYHLTHALAILAVGILAGIVGDTKPIRAAGWLFAVGILLFSGSLYALALSGVRIIGAITPFGGLCFLAGWACLAVAALKK